jgi:hypothetical protein
MSKASKEQGFVTMHAKEEQEQEGMARFNLPGGLCGVSLYGRNGGSARPVTGPRTESTEH